MTSPNFTAVSTNKTNRDTTLNERPPEILKFIGKRSVAIRIKKMKTIKLCNNNVEGEVSFLSANISVNHHPSLTP